MHDKSDHFHLILNILHKMWYFVNEMCLQTAVSLAMSRIYFQLQAVHATGHATFTFYYITASSVIYLTILSEFFFFIKQSYVVLDTESTSKIVLKQRFKGELMK